MLTRQLTTYSIVVKMIIQCDPQSVCLFIATVIGSYAFKMGLLKPISSVNITG